MCCRTHRRAGDFDLSRDLLPRPSHLSRYCSQDSSAPVPFYGLIYTGPGELKEVNSCLKKWGGWSSSLNRNSGHQAWRPAFQNSTHLKERTNSEKSSSGPLASNIYAVALVYTSHMCTHMCLHAHTCKYINKFLCDNSNMDTDFWWSWSSKYPFT